MSYDSRPETWVHINKVQKNLIQISEDIGHRALRHDQSKLYFPEVEVLDKVTPRLKDLEYGSDEYRAQLAEMSVMTDHHYLMNDHHPEYHPDGIHEMNLIQLMEMLADWKAACERHSDGDLASSIEMNADRFGYDQHIRGLLMSTARYLGWLRYT